ncbi:hypothetical protein [Leptolyngbya sp. FACHB-261]|uniref:hypothetical protein n=1 Tax=Leptolyngbya sp. FACHB-261 TaxID=2692806 RepID=UPI001689DE22|nr:hypothetical protein [Leptolyngbya sp. FACHB-261]MBD2100231.1 hypothetical protein [Leptolyngbya sp. FACHB-261]
MLRKRNGAKALIAMVLWAFLLTASCTRMQQTERIWIRYSDPVSGQSLVYPNDWVVTSDANGDKVFHTPASVNVQVRIGVTANPEALPTGTPNFLTAQRDTGWLTLQTAQQPSTLTLRLVRGSLTYTFEASTDRDRFNEFLPYFYYMASQYTVKPVDGSPLPNQLPNRSVP